MSFISGRIKLGILGALFTLLVLAGATAFAQTNPQSGSTGLSGTVPADPPTTGATITQPTNGQVFSDIPITVSGTCPDDLLVKLFKNNVFTGSDKCSSGGFSVVVDLFAGENELVARVFDALDQAGPDSNIVTVVYNDDLVTAAARRVRISSNFASRGADPGKTLIWPISIAGGSPPYAVKIDWGDGNEDLLTRTRAGEFNIEHVYSKPGSYKLLIKATDDEGQSGYLQLVAIANGPLTSTPEDSEGAPAGRIVERWVAWPTITLALFVAVAFWIGRHYESQRLKQLFAEHNLFIDKDK